MLAGCASQPTTTDYVAGFDPGPVPDGYTRYLTPIVKDIVPGADVEYCQWVAGASDSAQDQLALVGAQSKTGHHAILYATTNTSYAVGESHICTVDDMVPISFLGSIGGEGNSVGESLPDGLFLRLPAGQALMANTHWLNATDKVVDGQAAIDVKFVPADPSRMTADIFANNGDEFTIPAGGNTAYDNSCVLQDDLNFAMVGNHMHLQGTSVYSEIVHMDGTKDMLVMDSPWVGEQEFNPRYERYSVAAPYAAHKGDTFHTHCEWANPTASPLMFPDEMCVGVGFYFPSHGQIACSDGDWTN